MKNKAPLITVGELITKLKEMDPELVVQVCIGDGDPVLLSNTYFGDGDDVILFGAGDK